MPDPHDPELPPPPERPDCCFGGCAQCVLDDYADQMQRWQEKVDAILAQRARHAAGPEPPLED